MKRKVESTFDREMRDHEFSVMFEESYKELLLSELMCAIMKEDNKTVRKLAEEVGLSPTVIQKLRSGKQEDVKLRNFLSILRVCGFKLVLEKGKKRLYL
ncbi:MAG: hypothetical protein DHS20C10_05220 [marine bacterium B5-7]|nr:MAG: hypothetical protein DHS20C10_05220 [marine bacterium B5-7]